MDIAADLIAPDALPALWPGDEVGAGAVEDYFSGGKTVQVDKGGYTGTGDHPEGVKRFGVQGRWRCGGVRKGVAAINAVLASLDAGFQAG